MKIILLLFLMTLIVAFCTRQNQQEIFFESDSTVVSDTLQQQELRRIPNQRDSAIVRQAVKEHYGFDFNTERDIMFHINIEKIWLVIVFTPVISNGQIWFSIDKTTGKVESTEIELHGENITEDEKSRNNTDRINYTFLLQDWKLNGGTQWYNNANINTNIDSITAVTIAVDAATKHYDTEMSFLTAKPMGYNGEHWLIYLFPTDYTIMQELCYMEFMHNYKTGLLFIMLRAGLLSSCPIKTIVQVLISKENGRVLAMSDSI